MHVPVHVYVHYIMVYMHVLCVLLSSVSVAISLLPPCHKSDNACLFSVSALCLEKRLSVLKPIPNRSPCFGFFPPSTPLVQSASLPSYHFPQTIKGFITLLVERLERPSANQSARETEQRGYVCPHPVTVLGPLSLHPRPHPKSGQVCFFPDCHLLLGMYPF